MNKKNPKKSYFLGLSSGLRGLGQKLLAGFLVWCIFNYNMDDYMRFCLVIWAVWLSL